MIAVALVAGLFAAAPSEPPAPGGEAALLAAAESALARGASGEAARAFEEAAARSLDPAPTLVRAARVRRAAAEEHAWKASAQRGFAAAPELDAAGREAQACADDARRSWQRVSPEAAQALLRARPAGEIAELVPAASAEALYLDAVCAAIWARSQGVTPLLERQGELRAFLERAAKLAPDLDEAGPDRELGRLLSSLPAYAGGDLDGARSRFERSLSRAPAAARTRVAYAEGFAVKAQDRALFEKQLLPVSAEADKSPLADKARALLQRADELFGKGTP